MKLRYFLRGLGAGIVFAVLVLGVSGGTTEKADLSDNEIIARARELGMVTEDEKLDESLSQLLDDTETQDNKKTQDDKETAADAEKNNEVSEGEQEGSKNEDTADGAEAVGDTSEGETESVLPEPLEEEETQVTSKITITRGMTSAQVANAFYQLGLIDNIEAFDDYLCDNGYSSKIRVGTFIIEGKPDYRELARIITTEQ